ncbi:MAG: LacI family transcriptional regulator [Defluviitaleaceae bacterium]|nr:LacI family transcriptional regulator [Defluviitaleaceae bacterium]
MATIKDVAKHAGVSVSAVSKTFNNYSEISDETKEKIFRAAKELDYIPNKSAVELSRGRKPYLGFIVMDLNTNSTCTDEYIFRLLSGAHERSCEIGQELIVFTTQQIKRMKQSYSEFCRHHTLMGAIVHGIEEDEPYFGSILESPIPCVLIDVEREGKHTAFVTTDNEKASEEVVDLFASKGHRKICHILGHPDSEVAKQRHRGFLNAARRHMFNEDQVYVIPGDFIEEVAYANTRKILQVHRDITAIYAASDLMALGALRAIKEIGFTPGKDIALVGFDGLKAPEYTTPPLATIYQDFHSMGRLAVDTLQRISKNQPFCGRNYVPHTLLHRGSV